jgi:hypothetical protein
MKRKGFLPFGKILKNSGAALVPQRGDILGLRISKPPDTSQRTTEVFPVQQTSSWRVRGPCRTWIQAERCLQSQFPLISPFVAEVKTAANAGA